MHSVACSHWPLSTHQIWNFIRSKQVSCRRKLGRTDGRTDSRPALSDRLIRGVDLTMRFRFSGFSRWNCGQYKFTYLLSTCISAAVAGNSRSHPRLGVWTRWVAVRLKCICGDRPLPINQSINHLIRPQTKIKSWQFKRTSVEQERQGYGTLTAARN